MRKRRDISYKKQWLAISLGVVIGTFVLGLSVYMSIPTSQVTEQSDPNESTTVSDLTIEAVPSAVQPTVERTSYLIEIIPEIEEPESEDVNEESFLPSPAKVFKILFEHIVSPNSP
ncbi:MAG: hypothetical protein GY816_00415 [Cytophagales bacterium]|nr:hypothetical protein [Cytophagales bacterium]